MGASLTTTCPSSTWSSSKREMVKSRDSPISKSHEDSDPRELTTSESSLPWTNRTLSPFNANEETRPIREPDTPTPKKPKPSTESSLTNVPRTPRRRRRKDVDHPSQNQRPASAPTKRQNSISRVP